MSVQITGDAVVFRNFPKLGESSVTSTGHKRITAGMKCTAGWTAE